jgi:hypothetical protein
LRAASPAEGLKALAPSTVLFFPGSGAEQLTWLARLATTLECHVLELGADLDDIPACLNALVAA